MGGFFRLPTRFIAIATNCVESARFKGSHLALGTTDTTPALHIALSWNSLGLVIRGSSNVTQTNDLVRLQDGSGVTLTKFDAQGRLSVGTSTPLSSGTVAVFEGGNVGISTTSPFEKLSVAGNGYFDGSITASSLTATSSLQLPDGASTTPSLTFTNDTNTGLYRGGTDILRFVTGGQDRVTIDASGKVGIGVTNPTKLLEVGGINLRMWLVCCDWGMTLIVTTAF
ncbi:MAG: hypothetical protein KatS3mg099_126 [Candidatus Parcubacteria bacterium]|nr:MAG: hypothetical protein KatS3mg099_126 [Candidatus Parcubacteria bacterium]